MAMYFTGNWRVVFLAIIVCICPSVVSAECPRDREDCHFTVLTTKFESENPALGANVALALQHQIFRNFLISIPGEPDDICCFPRDTIALLTSPLAQQTREEAERRGRQGRPSILVLWGRTWPWREHTVVQPYLSMIGPPSGLDPSVWVCCTNTDGLQRQRPFTRQGGWNIWEISARDIDGNSRTLSIDEFPRDFYELPQISLNPDDVDRFGSLAGLPVHDEIGGSPTPGVRPTHVLEAHRHVREWTRHTEPRGWIR